MLRLLTRFLGLLVLCGVCLQLFFVLRVGLMRWVDPGSTAFQRSEAWRILSTQGRLPWRQDWRDDAQLGDAIKRAVIASEDAAFTEHGGVDWDAIEKAWERNQRAEAQAERAAEAARQRQEKAAARGRAPAPAAPPPRPAAKVVGGSTISQQLAKNLFLSSERSLLRKGQEFAITMMLEALLPKRRILEIYLNHVEWGEGVFGAQAAANHYFRTDARRLSTGQAARLAVMLPAPKRFEKRPQSGYLASRSATIAARMGAVELP
jgi:monofunctional biosynthetic peptidoglycan transglycosylase